MADKDDTPVDTGIEAVAPEQNDTVPDYVYHDPDEETGTEEAEDMDTTDDGAESAEAEEPKEEPAEDEAEAEGDEDETGDKPEVFVLPDGTEADRDEVVRGYLRQQDYTRKTQEVAEKRKKAEAEVQRIEGITEAFIDHLTRLIPSEPDAALAYRDPQAYTRQKAAYDAAIQQVQQLVEMGGQAKEVASSLTESQRTELAQSENARLMEKFPEISKPEARKQFFQSAAEAATEVGFSMEELGDVMDHRLFALAHWANEGMKAAKSRDKAKAKAAKAPPVTPRKPGQGKQKPNRNAEAMRKLQRSGSIRDALAVDFD
jgi:hypothetical protein